VKYARVYADQNGDTHVEDVDVEMSLADFAPPAPPVYLSAFMESAQVGFLRMPAGWTSPPHASPRRQLVFVLSGEAEAAVSDEVRRMGPGGIVLLEDTTGKGHATRVIGDEDVLLALVQLPD
jgi:quercetin dioxygenase-like cupin family protein